MEKSESVGLRQGGRRQGGALQIDLLKFPFNLLQQQQQLRRVVLAEQSVKVVQASVELLGSYCACSGCSSSRGGRGVREKQWKVVAG